MRTPQQPHRRAPARLANSRSGNRGFTLAEVSDPQALYKWALDRSDLMTFEACVVLDDAEFGRVLGAGQ